MDEEGDRDESLPDGAAAGLALLVEHCDRPPTATAKLLDATARTYCGRQMVGAEVGVTLGKAKAAVSAFEVGVNGPSLGTSLNLGFMTGLHAGTKVEIAKAEARSPFGSVATGLNFNSGVTIGASGVGVKVLGFGFNIGWLGGKLSCPVLEIGIGANDDGDS